MIDKVWIKYFIGEVLEDNPPLFSKAAVNLMLLTLAVESDFGSFEKQIGLGGALSMYQIEELTFHDLQNRFGEEFPYIRRYKFEDLLTNMYLSTLVARIKYYSIPKRLPRFDDIEGLAQYWKEFYNTSKYGSTVEEAIDKYNKYVLGKE